jgi:hypothetical protein
MRTTTKHLVVTMDFSIGLLEQWQPPTTVSGGLGKSWLRSRVRPISVYREQIINCHILRSALDETSNGKDAFMSVFLLPEQFCDSISPLAQSCDNSQKVIVTKGTLF